MLPPTLPAVSPAPEASRALIESMRDQVVTGHSGYLKGQVEFVQKIAEALPLIAEKMVNYMLAVPVHLPDANGKMHKVIAPADDMTDGQLALLKTMMPKLLPGVPNVPADPSTIPPQPGGNTSTSIVINTVGPQVVDGKTGGIQTGEAKRVTTITFNPAYDASDPRAFDLEPGDMEPAPRLSAGERAMKLITEAAGAEAAERMAVDARRMRGGKPVTEEDLV